MSENTVASLQAAIEKMAAQKLDKDLATLCCFIEDHPLLGMANKAPTLVYEGNALTPYRMFRFLGSSYEGRRTPAPSAYISKLREIWLPVYIERETEAILQAFDSSNITDTEF